MVLREIRVLSEIRVKPLSPGFMEAVAPAACEFITDEGTWHAAIEPGWVTDLRSGSPTIDYLLPKWGGACYTWAICAHDLAFSGLMSFELANELFLRQALALSGEVSKRRAGAACWAVSTFGRGHYVELSEELSPPYSHNRPLERLWLEPHPCHTSPCKSLPTARQQPLSI